MNFIRFTGPLRTFAMTPNKAVPTRLLPLHPSSACSCQRDQYWRRFRLRPAEKHVDRAIWREQWSPNGNHPSRWVTNGNQPDE